MKKPLCAHCGKSILRTNCIIVTYEFPGRPTVGWHWDKCHDADTITIAKTRVGTPIEGIRAAIEEIDARGPGRVVAGKRWKGDRR